jgi:hypothetical protein
MRKGFYTAMKPSKCDATHSLCLFVTFHPAESSDSSLHTAPSWHLYFFVHIHIGVPISNLIPRHYANRKRLTNECVRRAARVVTQLWFTLIYTFTTYGVSEDASSDGCHLYIYILHTYRLAHKVRDTQSFNILPLVSSNRVILYRPITGIAR